MPPLWPVFMACSMSNASFPRHSPMMIRSGRMRNAFRSRSRRRDFTALFDVRRPRFHSSYVRLLQLQFRSVLDGDDSLGFRNVAGQHVQ